jgi:uncharacterized phiE125 gp8 family phage protein
MISVYELREWLRAEPEQDGEIADLLRAATAVVHLRTGRYFGPVAEITETVYWNGGYVQLSNEPLTAPSGEDVILEEWDGTAWVDVDATTYYRDGAFIRSNNDASWGADRMGQFRATYYAGHEVDDIDEDVWEAPEDVKQAVRMLVTHWFENRGVVSDAAANEIPLGVDMILSAHARVVV